jgi:nucleoside-diphosphate-sugar epimerase
VDDVIDGMITAATRHGVEGETIDLGSGILVTVREVVDTIVDLMKPGVQPVFDPAADRPVEVTRVADLEGAKRLIEWEPATGLREGLARTIAWYRAQRAAAL